MDGTRGRVCTRTMTQRESPRLATSSRLSHRPPPPPAALIWIMQVTAVEPSGMPRAAACRRNAASVR